MPQLSALGDAELNHLSRVVNASFSPKVMAVDDAGDNNRSVPSPGLDLAAGRNIPLDVAEHSALLKLSTPDVVIEQG